MIIKDQLTRYIGTLLAEAKKKKEKADRLKYDPKPPGYSYDEAFDFSAPLGAYNLYRTQGAVNWGPMTSAGTKIDDKVGVDMSAWAALHESVSPTSNVWESASRWYDHNKLGLGSQTSEGIQEKIVKLGKKARK